MPDREAKDHLSRGTALLQGGWLRAARDELEQAVVRAPRDPCGWLVLAQLHRATREFADAAAAIETALALRPGDPSLLALRAAIAADRGEPSAALFREALRGQPYDPELCLGAAVSLHEEEEDAAAGLRAIEALGAEQPGWIPAHTALARLRWEAGDRDGFVDGFRHAIAREPDDPGIQVALIATLMKAGSYEAARREIVAARARFGAAQWFDEAEAACCSEIGLSAAADVIFARLAGHNEPGLAIAHARHLLRTGDPARAAARLEPAVRLPGGHAGWPYLATAWRMLGDTRWSWLEGDQRLIGVIDLGLSATGLERIAGRLRALHRGRHAPFDQTLRGGTQTRGSVLDRVEPELAELRAVLADAVAGYVAQLPPVDAAHPFLATAREARHFAGSWSSLLRAGGRHTNHVHPAGWISSAFYVELPDACGKEEGDQAGRIAFGQPPREMGIDLAPFRTVEPRVGRLMLFPSIMWHGTVPFASGERLTIAFDIVPTP